MKKFNLANFITFKLKKNNFEITQNVTKTLSILRTFAQNLIKLYDEVASRFLV